MNEQGVFITTPGVFQVKSNEKVMEGGEYVGYEVVRLPKLGDYYLHFVMKDKNDHPLSGKSYILYNNDGEVVETGILDKESKTSVLYDKLTPLSTNTPQQAGCLK